MTAGIGSQIAYVQLDGKFFRMCEDYFEVLQPPPPTLDGARAWSWRWLPSRRRYYPVSHAVHPDERTIVFSMSKFARYHGKRFTDGYIMKPATFSFDVESSRWTRHGAWMLPFKGRGYFDADLDAWVGLSGDPDSPGHICACDVLSPPAADSDGDGQGPPACKLSKEGLFCVNPGEEHIGATLVYVGDRARSRFCLVQGLSVDDRHGGILEASMPDLLLVRHLLRITTFSLKYDKHGDLRVTKRRHISYRLPKFAGLHYEHLEDPMAFWM